MGLQFHSSLVDCTIKDVSSTKRNNNHFEVETQATIQQWKSIKVDCLPHLQDHLHNERNVIELKAWNEIPGKEQEQSCVIRNWRVQYFLHFAEWNSEKTMQRNILIQSLQLSDWIERWGGQENWLQLSNDKLMACKSYSVRYMMFTGVNRNLRN